MIKLWNIGDPSQSTI